MQRASDIIRRSSSVVSAACKAVALPKPSGAVAQFDYLRSDEVLQVLALQESFQQRYGRSSLFLDKAPVQSVGWSA